MADDGREIINRLSLDGETRVSLFGGDYDYDREGTLVFAAVRLTDFIWTREEAGEAIPQDISDFAVFLGGAMEGEIVAKIDISAKILTIVRVLEKTSFEQNRYYSLSPNGRTISMAAEVDGEDVAEVYFMTKIYRQDGILGFGVKGVESGEVVAVSVPLRICPELLDGDLAGEAGVEKINEFLLGSDQR